MVDWYTPAGAGQGNARRRRGQRGKNVQAHAFFCDLLAPKSGLLMRNSDSLRDSMQDWLTENEWRTYATKVRKKKRPKLLVEAYSGTSSCLEASCADCADCADCAADCSARATIPQSTTVAPHAARPLDASETARRAGHALADRRLPAAPPGVVAHRDAVAARARDLPAVRVELSPSGPIPSLAHPYCRPSYIIKGVLYYTSTHGPIFHYKSNFFLQRFTFDVKNDPPGG